MVKLPGIDFAVPTSLLHGYFRLLILVYYLWRSVASGLVFFSNLLPCRLLAMSNITIFGVFVDTLSNNPFSWHHSWVVLAAILQGSLGYICCVPPMETLPRSTFSNSTSEQFLSTDWKIFS